MKRILLLLLLLLIIYLFSRRETFITKQDSTIVYYINLDHRLDRKQQILDEIKKLELPDDKIVRIPGIYNKEQGLVGCSKSHIRALETFIDSGLDNCIIFEDDFQFLHEPKEQIENFFKQEVPYDVVMLSNNGGNITSSGYPGIQRINNTQTASGYIVSKQFAPTLLQNLKEGGQLLEQDYSNAHTYANDQYWKRLQPISNWFVFDPKLGTQRESFSDIQGGVVNYGV